MPPLGQTKNNVANLNLFYHNNKIQDRFHSRKSHKWSFQPI